MKRVLIAALILGALVIPTAGCGGSPTSGYPGFSSPTAALDTFFQAKMKQDWETTWLSYSSSYSQKVTKDEFLQHSKEDPVKLLSYKVDSLTQSGDSAIATVTLNWSAPSVSSTGTAGSTASPAPSGPSKVTVQESLIKESGAWRIKVW